MQTTLHAVSHAAPEPRCKAAAWQRACWLLLALGLQLGLVSPVRASDDPPGRVGLIAWIEGGAQLQRAGNGELIDHTSESLINWPLTSGDLLSTGERARAELGIGSTRLKLGAETQLLLRRVDDDAIELELLRGSLALHLRSPEVARELLIDSAGGRHRPQGAGLFRLDAALTGRDSHAATAWRSDLRIEQHNGSLVLRSGQRAELYPDGGWRVDAPDADDFARWAMADEHEAATLARASGPLPPEMTGADRLDAHGDWERSPEWGWIWTPRGVGIGWAPYREGRWAWVAPWGWTWIDVAPWGFAPFHYGRWVQHRQRWAWVPGEYRTRPVYAPALVVWAGAPGLSLSIRLGPGVAWFPLAPREVYVPGYRCTPEHLQRLNRPFVGELRQPERILARPELVWRDTPYRHARGPAVSTIEDHGRRDDRRDPRDDRDGRGWRVTPWREALPLPPRLRAPEPPALRRPAPPHDGGRPDDRRREVPRREEPRRDEGRRDDSRRDDPRDRPDRGQPAPNRPQPQPQPAPGRPGDAGKRLPERPVMTQPGEPGPAGRTPTIPARPLQPGEPRIVTPVPPVQTRPPGPPVRPPQQDKPAAAPETRVRPPSQAPAPARIEPRPEVRQEAPREPKREAARPAREEPRQPKPHKDGAATDDPRSEKARER
jgi:hypothetical protein